MGHRSFERRRVAFGPVLWSECAPCWRCAETVNGAASLGSLIEDSVNGAWDVASTCLEEGPGGHHLPIPLPVLSALVPAALLKNWPRVASQLLGLTDILRLAGAGRLHLAIPQDVFFFVPWILLANPLKSAPRFQSARLDPQHTAPRHSFPRPFCGPRLLQLAAHVTLHWVIAGASWFAAIKHAITLEERGAELATEAADFWLETEDAS